MRFFSTIVLCVSLAAQEAVPPARFIPADSCVVLRVAAPAKWKQHFAKTQVGKLVGGETLAPFLAKADAAIEAGLEEVRSKGKLDVDLVKRLLSDYTGNLVFSLQIDFSDVDAAIEANRPPAMSMMCALTPDGSYDLGALATAMQTFIEAEIETENRGPLKDLVVGDLRLRVSSEGRMQTALPFLHDGHLVILTGPDLEKAAARLLGASDRWEGEVDGRPLFAYAQLDRLMEMLMKVAAEEQQRGAPFDVKQMLQDLGLGSLKSARLALGAEDKHVVSELHVSVGDGERGLFGALMLDQARPKLLRWVPANSESFSVSAFDPAALFRTIRSVWEHLGPMVPITFEQAMAAFTEATKVQLEEELLAHLGTEFMMIGDVEGQLDVATLEDMQAAAMLGGSCFGAALRNGKAFGESLEKILRSRGLHAARKSEDYADTKVHRLTIGAMLELEYVVTDDLLLLVLGKDEAARRNLRAVLDARAKSGEGSEIAPAVAAHVAAVPAGWSGISVTQVAQMVEATSAMLGAMSAMGGPEMQELEAVVPVMKGLAGEMKRFGLQLMISTSHTSERSYVQRLRW